MDGPKTIALLTRRLDSCDINYDISVTNMRFLRSFQLSMILLHCICVADPSVSTNRIRNGPI